MVKEEFLEVLQLDPRIQTGIIEDNSRILNSYTLFDTDNLILHIIVDDSGLFNVMHLKPGEELVVKDTKFPWAMACVKSALKLSFAKQKLNRKLKAQLEYKPFKSRILKI